MGAILLIKWIIDYERSSQRRGERDALEILDERYARDEIGGEEYEKRKR